MTEAENKIEAQPAVLHAVVHVTRKATGLTETYEIVGTALPPEPETQKED